MFSKRKLKWFLASFIAFILLLYSTITTVTLYNTCIEVERLQQRIGELEKLDLKFFYALQKVRSTQKAAETTMIRFYELLKSTGLLDKRYKHYFVDGGELIK